MTMTIARTLCSISICVIFFAACTPKKERQVFKIPTIVNAVDSNRVTFFNVDSCNPRIGYILYKGKFTDTLINTDSIDYDYREDSTTIKLLRYEYKQDSFRSDGFQIYTDYKTTIAEDSFYTSYPMYMVNETSNPKVLWAYARDVVSHEALDSNNTWRPIEYNSDVCGIWCKYGFEPLAVNVEPGEYVMYLLPKYSGDYKTKLRVRIRAFGEHVYVSEPFEGRINYSQFYVQKNTCLHTYLKYGRREYVIKQGFSGTVPLGYDVEE